MSNNHYPSLTLTLKNLACVRGDKLLFQELNLEAASGEVLEVKGPNGVGKSSLLRIIAGLAPAYDGAMMLASDEDTDLAIEEHAHFLSHQNALKDGLSVTENLTFWHHFSREQGLSPSQALEQVALPHLAELPVGVLSAGQKRRVAFARLLVERRAVWLLDEPTAALDARADALVGGLISNHAKLGGIVLAATHLPLQIDTAQVTVKTLQLDVLQGEQS
ncbi:MAG: heme ABC exporter ATP-binding protein CcmA [Hyphomicrobiales bacterium]